MAYTIKPQTQKQQTIRDSIEEFLNSDSVLVLPTIGGGRFEYHMNDISVAVDTLYNALDGALETLHQDARNKGTPITCSKGCSYCCNQPVACSIPESIFIVTHLNENPDTLEHFLSRYQTWRGKFDPYKYSEIMNKQFHAMINGKSEGPELRLFAEFNCAECPFLKDNACSIYPVRPTVCRGMLSIDDPEKCRNGEIALLAQGRKFHGLVTNKQGQIYSKLIKSLGTKAQLSAPLPLSVYEIFHGKKDYIEKIVKQANKRIRDETFPHVIN